MFSGYGLLVPADLRKGLEMNGQYFWDVVLEEARQAVIANTKKSGIQEGMIDVDNSKVHNSAKTSKRLAEFLVRRLPHRRYFPDISACNFWFFGWSKDVMQGQKFRGPDQV
jgi:hypothetical protein